MSSLSSASAYDQRCIDLGCDLPFGWEDETPPPVNPPFPEGFVLTIPQRSRTAANTDQPSRPPVRTLNRYPEVATAISQCWDPAADVGDRHWGAITLRVSFKRDGSVNGIPRIVYGATPADADSDQALRHSLLSALSRCTPLHLSSSLGNAIAGQIFAIRFVQQGN